MEYKMKCNVCGKIFCYTDEDLKQNASNAGMAALSALGGLASTLGGGTILHTHHLQGQADRYSDKVVDYNQCPHCHSRDISFYTDDKKAANTAAPAIEAPAAKAVTINSSASTESLLKRVFLFLEDGEWASADSYCEACLDVNPELAEAYLAKLMIEKKARNLEELGNCKEPLSESKNYQKVIRYGNEVLAAQLKELCGNAEKNIKRLAEIRERLNDPDCSVMLDVMDGHVIALCADGSIQTCNNRDGVCNSDEWKDLISIEMGYSNTVGLRADGTVVACGKDTNLYGKNIGINDNVSKWKDIKAIRIAGNFVVGLRIDGTVVACGKSSSCLDDEKWDAIVRNVNKWKDIVAIDATTNGVVGLCRNGSVKYGDTSSKTHSYITSLHDIANIQAVSYHTAAFSQNGTVKLIASNGVDAEWSNVKSISGEFVTKVCLRDDGTVFTWKDDDKQLSVDNWKNIVAIDSGASYVVGLTQNGTVVACGNNNNGQCNVSDWKDIVAIKTNGALLTVGIRADGTVVSCGSGSGDSQKVDCSTLKLFNDVTDLDANIARNKALRIAAEKAAEERRIAEEKAAEEKRKISIAQLEWEKQNLQAEIPNIKGIFAGGKKKKLEARIAEIDAELKKLNA